MSKDAIILIGPMGAGKSTIGERLAQQLGRPWVQMDEVRFDYYNEIGYDNNVARAKHQEGKAALFTYWKPFEVHAVERIVADHADAVIDFGAGHSVYEDPALLERAKRAIEPFPNVVLLLPTPDPDESLAILTERLRQIPDFPPEAFQLNDHFLRHPSNQELAKITVYTHGKTPDETCTEIMGKLTR
ncbi:MAG: shikimate kinase [Anaerolineae bacterium]|nr:shikimate kinase [Anaerolineae bacterium]